MTEEYDSLIIFTPVLFNIFTIRYFLSTVGERIPGEGGISPLYTPSPDF